MEPIIKFDLNKMLKDNSPIILELGCGKRKKKNRIGIDKLNLSEVDIVADLEQGLPFFPDDSVDEIHSRSFLEHIHNFELLMKEIIRVLKVGGKCLVFVPHFSNPYFYSDYTHSKFFGLYTFYYFVKKENQMKRKVPNFYTDISIKILSQRLIFRSPFKGRNAIKKFYNFIFNINTWLQEFYEENLCYIIPCYGIEVVFTPDKD